MKEEETTLISSHTSCYNNLSTNDIWALASKKNNDKNKGYSVFCSVDIIRKLHIIWQVSWLHGDKLKIKNLFKTS